MTIRHVITEQLLEIRMKSRHSGLDYRSQDGILTQKGSGLDWIRKCFGENLCSAVPSYVTATMREIGLQTLPLPVKRIVRSFERLDVDAGPACRISSPD